MRALGLLVLVCFLTGCAHMHIVCQDMGTTSLAVGGNTAGQQILSLGLAAAGAAASGAKLMAVATPQPKAPTAQSQSYVDYNYMPLFGPDYASCSALPPLSPPTSSIVFFSPSGGAPQVITLESRQVMVAPTVQMHAAVR